MPHSRSSSNVERRWLDRIESLAHRGTRDRTGLCWIEGVRNLLEAARAGYAFEAVVVSPTLLKVGIARDLDRRLQNEGVPSIRISPEVFRSISRADRASGIGAIVRQRWVKLQETIPLDGLCWIVVERIRSPGNLGSILRTAEAAGIAGAIFVGTFCDPYDPSVIRGSMSSLFGLRLIRSSIANMQHWAEMHRVLFVGLSPDGENLWRTDLPTQPTAIVVGEERSGISPELRPLCSRIVALPMVGRADSLNVSVAAGIGIFEIARRREDASHDHRTDE